MIAEFIAIRPSTENGYLPALATAMSSRQWSKARVAFAFVSRSGTSAFLSRVQGIPGWPGLRKELLVGIHQGITDPDAVRSLSSAPNAACRMFVPKGRLNGAALFAAPLF